MVNPRYTHFVEKTFAIIIKSSIIFPPPGAIKLYFYINSDLVQNDTTHFLPQGTTTLSCQYDRIFAQPPSLVEVNHEGLQITNFPVQSYSDPQSNVFVNYTVPATQATSSHIYRCVHSEAIFIQVTITFGGEFTRGKYQTRVTALMSRIPTGTHN